MHFGEVAGIIFLAPFALPASSLITLLPRSQNVKKKNEPYGSFFFLETFRGDDGSRLKQNHSFLILKVTSS